MWISSTIQTAITCRTARGEERGRSVIKHIVFWKVTPPGDRRAHEEVYREFKQKTENLKRIIPEIVEATVGFNYVEGDVFNICIDSLFKSKADLETYINHPEHLKVRAYLNSVTHAKEIFDYEF